MPLEHQEDWRLAAENRRRRRMGLPEVAHPDWPSEEFCTAQAKLFKLAFEVPGAVTQDAVRESACMFIEEKPTTGMQARMTERMVTLLAEARANAMRAGGTREPGEEG